MIQGFARSLCSRSWALAALVVLFCVSLSGVGLILNMGPKAKEFLEGLAARYDSRCPQITIKNGLASIREESPRIIDFGDKDVAVVIDTREGKQNEATHYLRNAEMGMVLTRDTVVSKMSGGEIRTFPLKDFPDVVVNSHYLQELLDRNFPSLFGIIAVLTALYYLVAKPVQVLVFAFIPYFAARAYTTPLTYGDAAKLASFALIAPVLPDVALNLTGISVPGGMIVYGVVYIAVLILAARDLVAGGRGAVSPEGGIHPA